MVPDTWHPWPSAVDAPEVEPDPIPVPGLLLDAPDGPHPLGPPTVDSDADGRADTTVLTEPDALDLATDLDADGRVDVLTTLGADGRAVTVEYGAGDRWDEGVPPPAPILDPTTGAWVRGG